MNWNRMVVKSGQIGCWCDKEVQKLWPKPCCAGADVVVTDMCSSFAVVVTGIPYSIESFVLVKRDAFDDCKIGQDRMIRQVVFITIVVL